MNDPNGSSRGDRGRRRRDRQLALGLGTALSLVLLGGLAWATTYGIGGTERCETCGVTREVRLAGLVRDEPRPDAAFARAPCGDHDWRRRGCWTTLVGFSCHR